MIYIICIYYVYYVIYMILIVLILLLTYFHKLFTVILKTYTNQNASQI